MQESEIASILPLNARLCYLGLKIIFKKYIKTKMETGLKSYHMLTLFFWFMESNQPSTWEDDSEEAFCQNLSELLGFLNKQIRRHMILHYFMRKINLIESLNDKDLLYVYQFIKNILQKPEFPR